MQNKNLGLILLACVVSVLLIYLWRRSRRDVPSVVVGGGGSATGTGTTRAGKSCTCDNKTSTTTGGAGASATGASTGTSATGSSVAGLSASTSMYLLAWSNTGDGDKTTMPSDGTGAIVMLDGDDSASEVQKYKDRGYLVAGYISAGSWEDWRDDKSEFPDEVFGKPYPNWPDETLFKFDNWPLLIPGMTKRMQKLKEKGFQYVEFDNIENSDESDDDQVDYTRRLGEVALEIGLGPLFKNAADLIRHDRTVQDNYVGFICEESIQWGDTEVFHEVAAGQKPIWIFEYDDVSSSDLEKARSHATEIWFDTNNGWERL